MFISQYNSIANPTNELKNKTNWIETAKSLQGFSWNSKNRGISMWSDVFLHTNEIGEKLAIVMMETRNQCFLGHTTPDTNFFVLETLISSIVIFDLDTQNSYYHLPSLEFAKEFAQIDATKNLPYRSKPFQKLLFLIKDLNNPEKLEFGIESCKKYLKDDFDIDMNIMTELEAIFEQIDCCLMPHPGKYVARNSKHVRSWHKMAEKFKNDLLILIPKILAPENLVVKKINSKDLNCFEMKEYIESYFTLFQSDTLPEAQSIYDLTIHTKMKLLIRECMYFYKSKFEENEDLSTENLQILHERSKNATISRFIEQDKIGVGVYENYYLEKLQKQIKKSFLEWKQRSL